MEATKENNKFKLFYTGYLYFIMLCYAIVITMLGPLMPDIIRHYGLRLSQGGLLMTYQSIGGVLAIIVGGLLADVMKKSKLIIIAFIIYTVSLLLIGIEPSFKLVLAIFLFLGVGTRMLDTVLNAYIADLHSEKRGLFISLLHTFFGIGALLGPIYARILLGNGVEWHKIFYMLGFVCMFILLFYIILAQKNSLDVRSNDKDKKSNYSKLFKSPSMWILALIMVMYVGHQLGITVWLPMYMEEVLKVNVSLSSFSLSIFWVGIILSRIAASHLVTKFGPRRLIFWGALAGGIVLVLGFLTKIPILLVSVIGIAGFTTGSIIPLIVTLACDWYPENSGTASSIIFVSGSVSSMIFPWLIGTVAEAFSFQMGMLITGLTLLIIVWLIILLPVSEKSIS